VQSAHGDAYHSAYNDYLWQLALADGATPPVSTPLPTNGTTSPLGTSSPASTSRGAPDDQPLPRSIEGAETEETHPHDKAP
jgi:hypothetical protein